MLGRGCFSVGFSTELSERFPLFVFLLPHAGKQKTQDSTAFAISKVVVKSTECVHEKSK